VEKLEKQRFKTTDRPQAPREEPSEDPRHIPAHVMREVYRRDGGRCTYVGTNGRRCRCRAFLEFDHITPIALGGKSITENLRLRCRAHNQLTARETFGEEHMSLRASGFHPAAAPGRALVPKRDRDREAIDICNRLLGPRGEPDILAALRRRRAERAGTKTDSLPAEYAVTTPDPVGP
jgi:5-methylcytosine-specific restriction endonuclease McrA